MDLIKRLLKPPVFEDHEKTIIARLLHPLLLVVLILLGFFTPWFVLAEPAARLRLVLVAGAIMVSCVFLLWLENRGYVRLASLVFVAILWLGMTFLVFSGTGVRGPAYLAGYLALVAVSGLILGGSGAILTAGACTLAGILWLVADQNGLLVPAPTLSAMASWLIAVFFFWLEAYFLYFFSNQRQQALRQVQAELVERRLAEQALQQSVEITHTIGSALDLETVVSTVVRLGTELVGAEMGSMALLSSDGESLIETYNYNMPPSLFNPQPFLRGSSLGWAVLDAGKPIKIDQYSDHPYAMDYGIEAGLKAFLGVPVSAGERTLGVLKLFCREAGKSFSDRDQELALAIGQQAGIYIQNARLFAQIQQRAQQLSTLNEVGQAVATLRDLPALLDVVYEQTKRSLAPDVFTVALINPGGDQLYFPFIFDSGKRWFAPPMPLTENSIIIHVIRSGLPRLVNRTQEEIASPAPPHSQIGDTSRRAASLLFAPLLASDQVIGAITAQSYMSDRYHEDDLTLLEGIANHVAIAIQNSRLYEATRKQLDELSVLHQISTSAVETSDLVELFERAAIIIGRRLLLDDLSFWLFDEKKQILEGSAHYHMNQITHPLGEFIPLHVGIIGTVAATRQSMLVPDVSKEPIYQEYYPWVRSELCVPMHIGDHIIGVINAESRELAAFQDADERLLTTIAGLIAIAVERLRSEADLEMRVQERTEALEAANQELRSFSYSVSHDLRAPLRGIDGYSRLLLAEQNDQLSEDARYYLDMVRAGAQRMGQLIEDLLEFSRLSRQPLNRQTISTSQIIDQVLVELRPLYADRPVEIVVNELPACQADPGLLNQVFENLIENALKYSSKQENARIEIGCQQESGHAVYYVRDNGVGFDMQFADRIFGVFQRLHHQDEFEGTGVGLAIVQRIIHRHGGRVWAEAEVGKGATFYFTIPGDGNTQLETDHR